MPKTALVAGATGLVGRCVVDELLRIPAYQSVTGLVRRETERAHERYHEVVTDYQDLDALGSQLAADEVFCCLGTTRRAAKTPDAFRRVDLELPVAVAHAAHRQGAHQYIVVSSLGAHPEASGLYLRTKGELEIALQGVGFASLIVVRPSVLRGTRRAFRFAESIGKAVLLLATPLLRGSFRALRPIRAEQVGRAMVTLANMGLYGCHVVESDRLEELGR